MKPNRADYDPIPSDDDLSLNKSVSQSGPKRSIVLAGWVCVALVLLIITLNGKQRTAVDSDIAMLGSKHSHDNDPTFAPTPFWDKYIPDDPAEVPSGVHDSGYIPEPYDPFGQDQDDSKDKKDKKKKRSQSSPTADPTTGDPWWMHWIPNIFPSHNTASPAPAQSPSRNKNGEPVTDPASAHSDPWWYIFIPPFLKHTEPGQPTTAPSVRSDEPPYAIFIPEPFDPFTHRPTPIPTKAPTNKEKDDKKHSKHEDKHADKSATGSERKMHG